MIKAITIQDIAQCLQAFTVQIIGDLSSAIISNLSTPENADEQSLIWVSKDKLHKEKMITHSKARVVVCDTTIDKEALKEKCLIITDHPKLVFTRIGNTYFKAPPLPPGIHPTAIVHPAATIAKTACIGAYANIGPCIIDEEAIIHPYTIIHDRVRIGKRVLLHAGCQVGATGLGHIFNENQELENFPQIGETILEDDVALGANSIVYRGALAKTQISRQTILDGAVIVGHNVLIGSQTMIAAGTCIGGSSVIGDRVFIGIKAATIDYITIGNDAHIGAGVIVTENVPPKARLVARPPITLPA